ncbi:MAG: sigma-54 dependent transcriptional regulator [Planctomycetota bacterium]|jgi:DNA-binding NtrC family response regulator|nr:sigma-54 dependent transcriptional regulator [Planctomycetota bacterium]MDP7133339.1 sigma-54 dependent transcriptional regulator [Planctomycetota bacterium]MDP7254908.1 sigma-54 dependent transcriptional regulator [Planctomycetota bacterium]
MSVSQPLHVLVIDDEPSMRSVCEGFLRSFGHTVESAGNGESGLAQVEDSFYDLVVADYKLPGMDGLQVLQQVKDKSPSTEVIIMTAYADIESAVQAVRYDAFDYLPKPFELEEMQRAVRKLERIKRLTVENQLLRSQLKEDYSYDRIVGESDAIKRARQIVQRVSQEHATVLIEGENGTGKELVAKAIHYNSPRASKPFVPIDCAAIPPGQFEVELFGQDRGGVGNYKEGLLKMAEGGTVFLDAIGELPIEMQVKLLRAFQENSVRPVGSVHDLKLDVRVIAASNTPLEESIQTGQFRQEFYYLLNIVNITLPSLRERRGDTELLVAHFLETKSSGNRRMVGISEDALEAISTYSWPGNVRELENLVERALALGMSDRIEKEDLPPSIFRSSRAAPFTSGSSEDLKPLEEIEKDAILRTLERTGGDKMLAAQILGIDRSTLYRKLKRF